MTVFGLTPPALKPPIPPGTVPGERRYSWKGLLDKPTTLTAAGVAVALSDIPGQTTTIEKYLRSKGTGAVAGTPSWETVLGTEIFGETSATRKFLKSVGTGAARQASTWDTLLAADIIGDTSATRKFLKSVGTGAAGQICTWDTLTNADVGATSANTASAIVARDASNNFSAGIITAALNGNATTATTATNLSGGFASTNSARISVPTATPTTLFAANLLSIGHYIVGAGIPGGGSTVQAWAVVRYDGASVVPITAITGGTLSLSVSGANVRVTHTTGSTESVDWETLFIKRV